MARLNEAIRMAAQAHDGQVDKAGVPYILHPLRVMLCCSTEDERIAAVLHDAVEDSSMTVAHITSFFGVAVGRAVDALTHVKGEPYRDYVLRCKANPIAARVKFFDIQDNRQRMKELAPELQERLMKKYNEGMEVLIAGPEQRSNLND